MLHDARGCVFEPLSARPLRLVSLVPSTTETLFALGCGEALVGYTRFCVHPEGQVSQEKWIGGTKNPKLEQIVALRPDVVLANREENRAEDVAALEAAGIPVWVAEPRTVPDAIADVRALGHLLNRAAEGEALALALEQALASVRVGPSRTFAYLIWQEPWMVAGSETFVSSLLALAGGRNAFAGRYPTIALDNLRGVERILLASEPFPFAEKHLDALVQAGIPRTRLRLVDGERLSWHGVRLLHGLPYLNEVLA